MNVISLARDYSSAVLATWNTTELPHVSAILRILTARLYYGIGPRFFSLYSLGNAPRASWSDYILEEEALAILKSINPKSARSATQDKIAFTSYCMQNGLPTAPISFRIDRNASDADIEPPTIRTEAQWHEALSMAPDNLFIKLIDGAHGTDAFSATRQGDKWILDGKLCSSSAFYHLCLTSLGSRRGWIFQPRLSPHPDLAGIMPNGALGTVRAMTYLDREGAHLVYPLLRIPAQGNFTDNFSLGSSGNLIAAIDEVSGRMRKAKWSRRRDWPEITELEKHPDTGELIAGRALPYWEETKSLLLAAQLATPGLRTIGWDIAVTASGPMIVEGNSLYGTDIIQVAYGLGVRSFMRSLALRIGSVS
ncbi:sugar-transfer associated ATP-grasp domain-containing protein [Thauera propionica]|uniref:sugar-transfer associated ATP-grasp domain-containing protein n=1 Tax=Thauera propionica TaxID=2019431 RepID=UPI0023F3BA8A|nr:sugar-transfer associated ATP-grasp domain-containing protein [Thauera propionica]MDD3674118.1 sugar-transfer associated ATP-grasp domain-containing protein [Thauera propionica]